MDTICSVFNGKTLFQLIDGNILGYQSILESMQAKGLLDQEDAGTQDSAEMLRLNYTLRLKTKKKICEEKSSALLESVWL